MAYENIATTFTRTSANIEKMGAYYTDVEHCKDLCKLFDFSRGEVSVLEPSIGDASAVIACTGADKSENIYIFGVELADDVASLTKQNPYVEECLKADFLSGVRIRNNAFSFCFGNPPYMNDTVGEGERMELSFLKKVTNYLVKDGIICWVIPHRIFAEESYMRFWATRYETLHIFKFRKEEYEKWGQIALIGKKTTGKVFLKDEFNNFKEKWQNLAKIPELPYEWEGEKVIVPPSLPESIDLFGTIAFDPDEAASVLCEKGCELDRHFNKYVTIEKYVASNVGNPPIPPKNDSMYLLSVCGVGSGLVGEEGKDLHLQRGIAEVVEEKETEVDETSKKKKVIEKVVTRTAIKMTLIQGNGQIEHLM